MKAPGFGERKSSYLEDIAILTGAQVIKDELGLSLDKVCLYQTDTALRYTRRTQCSHSTTTRHTNYTVPPFLNFVIHLCHSLASWSSSSSWASSLTRCEVYPTQAITKVQLCTSALSCLFAWNSQKPQLISGALYPLPHAYCLTT